MKEQCEKIGSECAIIDDEYQPGAHQIAVHGCALINQAIISP